MPLSARMLVIVFLAMPLLEPAAQEPKVFPLPDERYKTDILLVVAHEGKRQAADRLPVVEIRLTLGWSSLA